MNSKGEYQVSGAGATGLGWGPRVADPCPCSETWMTAVLPPVTASLPVAVPSCLRTALGPVCVFKSDSQTRPQGRHGHCSQRKSPRGHVKVRGQPLPFPPHPAVSGPQHCTLRVPGGPPATGCALRGSGFALSAVRRSAGRTAVTLCSRVVLSLPLNVPGRGLHWPLGHTHISVCRAVSRCWGR